jgi:mannose-6-phosphate isomerase-like protein (cupin superfamily)
MRVIGGAGTYRAPSHGAPNDYITHLTVADMTVSTYSIPVGGVDDQTPHTEDEIYVVTGGRGRLVSGDGAADVNPGDVIFVPAGEDHQFVDVVEDLSLLVIFAPAYWSRARSDRSAD